MSAQIYELDLATDGLLPPGWADAVRAVAELPERHRLIEQSGDAPWFTEIVEGNHVRTHLPWAWELYHGRFRDFASASFGRPLYPSNRLRASMTLTTQTGHGANSDWHRDLNPVTGIFYATGLTEEEGGALVLQDEDGNERTVQPRAGLFVAIPGRFRHRVMPILTDRPRIALVVLYYDSPTDQPPAYDQDVYQ